MALLLSIDTATEYASICITNNNKLLAFEENTDQKKHGAFLQPAISRLCNIADIALADIDAIAITAGPGSYTGLRVALASAKGLCYALQKPLITVSTLEVMALAALLEATNTAKFPNYFCPMIDARRMEVFTAVYDADLTLFIQPQALVLDNTSFEKTLLTHSILFSGGGAKKCKDLFLHANASFSNVQHSANHLASLGQTKYNQRDFADLAYSEPFYLKDFFTPQKA